ncbi:UNVERIFIED_CONTAM: hypothetical protein HHA_238410 [Hammondia hammondi]|eukprot:XP_008887544.1 hypothetical protein HHA_238410 [Hammondia hammondi]
MKDRRKREQTRKELIQLEEEVLGKLFAAEMEAKKEEGRTRQDQQQKTQSEEEEFERRTEDERVNPKHQKEGEEEGGKKSEKKRERECRRGSMTEDTQVEPTEEEESNTREMDRQEEGKKHGQEEEEEEESEEDNDEGSDEGRRNPKRSETGRQQIPECLAIDATHRDTRRRRNKALLVHLIRGSLESSFPSSADDKDSDSLSQHLSCRDEEVQTDTGAGADAAWERETATKARVEAEKEQKASAEISACSVACSTVLGPKKESEKSASRRQARGNKSTCGLSLHRKVMSGLELLLQRGQAEKRLTFARPSTRHVGNKELLEAFVDIEKKRHWCRGVDRAAERRERSSDEEEPEEQAERQRREGERGEQHRHGEVEGAAERKGEEVPHGEKAKAEKAGSEGREREKEGKEGNGETESDEETERVEKLVDTDRLISGEDVTWNLEGGNDEGDEEKREEKERDEHEWLGSTWVCPLCDNGVRAFALMGGPGTRSKWIVERPKRDRESENREEREKRTELECMEEQEEEKGACEEQETQAAKGTGEDLEKRPAREEKEEGVRHNNARRVEMETEREDSDQEESTTEPGDGRAQRREDEDGRAGTETETERKKTEEVEEESDEAAKQHASSCLAAGADSRRRDRVFAVTLAQPERRGMRHSSLESKRVVSSEGGEGGFLCVEKETTDEVDRRRRLSKREVLTARRGQAPSAWISFEELRGLMLRWKGYRVLQMQRCSFSQDATTREENLAQRGCRKSKA